MAFWEAAFNGTYGSAFRIRVQADLVSQNIAANTSVVRYNAWWERTGNGTAYNGSGTTATTNRNGAVDNRGMGGYNMTGAGQRIYFAQNEDHTVGHDGNGNASPYYAASYNTGTVGSASAGGNVALPGFNRYLGYTVVTIDTITASSIRVRLATNGTMDVYGYSLNGGGSWADVAFTGSDTTFTINGLAPYTTYNLRFHVRKADSQQWTDNGNYSRTTLGYAIITTYNVSAITDTAFTYALTTDVPCNALEYDLNGSGWIAETVGNFTSFSKLFFGLNSDADYTIKTRVRRADSGLWTESLPLVAHTAVSSKFFDVGDY